MRCDQCEMLSINGMACHESGCPNSGKTWDADREQWIRYKDCFTCGYPVEVGESCNCQGECDEDEYPDTDEDTEIDEVEDEETTLDADRITDFE